MIAIDAVSVLLVVHQSYSIVSLSYGRVQGFLGRNGHIVGIRTNSVGSPGGLDIVYIILYW